MLGSRLSTSTRPPRRRTVAAAVALATTLPLLAVTATTPAQAAGPTRQIAYDEWTSTGDLQRGRRLGLTASDGALEIAARPRGRMRYRDPHGYRTRRYDWGRWISPWQSPGFAFSELIASWDARTPRHTWVRVEVRGKSETGQRSSWDTLAHWSDADNTFHRTSLGAQTDDLGRVAVDTWRGNFSMKFESWQLRVTLYRRAGLSSTPSLQAVGAMTSHLPNVDRVRTSRPGVARGVLLDVPRYSQMIHQGDYPEYDNGGEAWCSPTSVSMVLGYYDRLPRPRQYRWVHRDHPDRFVDHAARMQYDYEYDGAGNWPFSTAYAATRADSAFVTRLRNLREAERLVRAGIPLVASIAFGAGELQGAPLTSSRGHLLVIRGFTQSGDVIVNDPAAPDNGSVQRTYDRGQFEDAWIPASGGVVYVIRDGDTALPRTRRGNW